MVFTTLTHIRQYFANSLMTSILKTYYYISITDCKLLPMDSILAKLTGMYNAK